MNRSAIRLRVHDTLTERKVRLAARTKGSRKPLTLYVCGVTPYDSGHMGHAFTFSMFDVLVRFLESGGMRVRYVQNVTDIDDPLFERARQDQIDWQILADRETKVHIRDMTALGWRPPDFMPRVSDEISRILTAATRLHVKGYAYRTDALYFDVSSYRGYGRLSHLTRRSMLRKLRAEGLLGTVGPSAKHDTLDFPLWRSSAEGEPSWPSKFGPGRPGWHIECSAMAMRYLGEQIDIHGGGRDLVFSHHESERAQSESLTGKAPFARAWMHTGMVRYEGRKMSKSLGNLVKVSVALQRAPAAAVRLYLVSHRYRKDWDFSWPGLLRAARLVERARTVLKNSKGPSSPALIKEFNTALADDLDTPRAVRALRIAIRRRDGAAVAWMLGILTGNASLT
ncbi:MAG: class I tRNA ligase family protein [Candidatus Dormibacteraeota bacterium]|nr:class I tRNA ligase family protein [Candidatus Dormibacteraeota bacterium]